MAKLSWARIPHEFANSGVWAVSTLKPTVDTNGQPVIRGGKPVLDKAPRHPRTLQLLDMNQPHTWATFEECCASPLPAIGRLIQHGEGYVVVDLDSLSGDIDPEAAAKIQAFQVDVYRTFQSYAERSQSGDGCHIIVRANLNGGYRQPGFEVYGHQRYMITTGDVVREMAITPYQSEVDDLAKFMESQRVDTGLPDDQDDERTPDEIIELASKAKNGAKFIDLMNYEPTEADDRSALDASLAQLIVFWTKSHRLAIEVFARSRLWRGDGATIRKRGYESPEKYLHDYLLGRTFARAWNLRGRDEAEEVERFNAGQEIANVFLREQQQRRDRADSSRDGTFHAAAEDEPEVEHAPSDLPWPGGGLLADLANYIFSSALRPVPEVALAGAVTFLAGIAGRQFNISGTGLNQYVILAAGTGRGKEGAASGIDRLVSSLEKIDPTIQDYVGPGHIASGQGLVRAISERNSLWSVQAEFGHTLKIITDPRASIPDLRTRQALLDLFSKSGQGRKLLSSAYSDTEKNTKVVEAPNFCMLGETTPEKFFKAFDSDLVAEGFLPRFTCFIYEGPRVARNALAGQLPPPYLMEKLAALLGQLSKLKYNNVYVNIPCTPEAQHLLDEFDLECDNRINQPTTAESVELWNRAHLKVLRLAALAAVGDADHSSGQTPQVQTWHVEWALGVVKLDMKRMEARIAAGDVGEGEVTFESHVTKAVHRYLKMDVKTRQGYKIPAGIISDQQLVPYTFLRRVLRQVTEFTNHKLGVKRAIDDAIKDALDAEVIQRVPDAILEGKGLKGAPVYAPGPQFKF